MTIKQHIHSILITTIIITPHAHSITRTIEPTRSRSTQHYTVAIIGTGYVGLVSGAGLAEFGNTVICADIDQNKIDILNNGNIPIYEPGLKDVVARNIEARRLMFTADVDAAIKQADAVFIAVGTPMGADGSADLSYVESVVNTIARNIDNYKVVCTKSTVPIGTGAWIERTLLAHGVDADLFDVVSNPEFLREGCAVKDFLEPDRVVIGANTQKALNIMCGLYNHLFAQGTPHVLTTVTTSEMIKYASNAFLAAKLSFINEIANLCDATGGDAHTVAYAMGLDNRISAQFLKPGPGFGGSCFPKDSQALLYMGEQNNVKLPVVQASLITNETQKTKPLEKLLQHMHNNLASKTVAVLGLAFKANTDDVRYSPARQTIQGLLDHGAHVKVYDPAAMENMKALFPAIEYCDDTYQAVENADAIIVMTEWDVFKHMNLERVRSLVAQPLLIDARNIVNTDELTALGFTFDTIGRAYLNQ